MKLLYGLVVGWVICGALAIWAIVASRELMWGNLPSWFAFGWDIFLLFVAFALPAKVVILVNSIQRKKVY